MSAQRSRACGTRHLGSTVGLRGARGLGRGAHLDHCGRLERHSGRAGGRCSRAAGCWLAERRGARQVLARAGVVAGRLQESQLARPGRSLVAGQAQATAWGRRGAERERASEQAGRGRQRHGAGVGGSREAAGHGSSWQRTMRLLHGAAVSAYYAPASPSSAGRRQVPAPRMRLSVLCDAAKAIACVLWLPSALPATQWR